MVGRTINKKIPIADYGSDTSIYSCKQTNTLFRFYHDVTHLTLDKGFSKSGEYSVIEQHIKEAKEFGISELALRILIIDTRYQVDYYFHHKEFVNDQYQFMLDCLAMGWNQVTIKH